MDKSFWHNKVVLITGHTGFKGSWLTLWLLMLGAKVNGFSLEINNEQRLYKDLFVENCQNLNNLSGTLNDHEGDINNFNSLIGIINSVLLF